jgi:hypothetical protein
VEEVIRKFETENEASDLTGELLKGTPGLVHAAGDRTSDLATSCAQFMNNSTAGLSVRFFKNTISAEIRGPADFDGRTFKAA